MRFGNNKSPLNRAGFNAATLVFTATAATFLVPTAATANCDQFGSSAVRASGNITLDANSFSPSSTICLESRTDVLVSPGTIPADGSYDAYTGFFFDLNRAGSYNAFIFIGTSIAGAASSNTPFLRFRPRPTTDDLGATNINLIDVSIGANRSIDLTEQSGDTQFQNVYVASRAANNAITYESFSVLNPSLFSVGRYNISGQDFDSPTQLTLKDSSISNAQITSVVDGSELILDNTTIDTKFFRLDGTLSGNGTVSGASGASDAFFITATGSTLSPGNSIGTLSINGDLSLQGATSLVSELDPTASQNADLLDVSGDITGADNLTATLEKDSGYSGSGATEISDFINSTFVIARAGSIDSDSVTLVEGSSLNAHLSASLAGPPTQTSQVEVKFSDNSATPTFLPTKVKTIQSTGGGKQVVPPPVTTTTTTPTATVTTTTTTTPTVTTTTTTTTTTNTTTPTTTTTTSTVPTQTTKPPVSTPWVDLVTAVSATHNETPIDGVSGGSGGGNQILAGGNTVSDGYLSLTNGDLITFNEVHAEPYSSNLTVGLEHLDHIATSVMNRISSSHDVLDKANQVRDAQGRAIWLDASGLKGNVDGKDGLGSFNYSIASVIGGADLLASDQGSVGAFAGYGYQQMDEHDTVDQSFSAQSGFAGLYGTLYRDSWRLAASGGYSYSANKGKRNNPNVGLFTGGRAESDFDSHAAFIAAKAGYELPLTPQFKLTPFAAASYAHIWQGEARETGGGDFNYTVHAATADAVLTGLGFDWAADVWTTDTGTAKLVGFARYDHDWSASADSAHDITVTSDLFGTFNQTGQNRGAHSVTAGLGFVGSVGSAGAWRLGVAGALNEHGEEIGAGAHFSWRF
ncbi:autotransporter outer membrane beta-barrel domain-containing protein [Roseibium alexandrii]